METKEINSIKIKPVVHLALEPTEILGYDYFPTLYSNIYICSKRRSGKATLIYNILKHCVSKRTNVVLNTILEELNKSLEEEEDEKESIKNEKLEPKPKMELFPKEEPKERKERKPKKLAPEYVFIFDDLGNDLRHPSITQLAKVSRHYKCKLIFSSQYIHDLSNSCIKNLDYTLIFKSFNREKLLSLYEALDLSIEF